MGQQYIPFYPKVGSSSVFPKSLSMYQRAALRFLGELNKVLLSCLVFITHGSCSLDRTLTWEAQYLVPMRTLVLTCQSCPLSETSVFVVTVIIVIVVMKTRICCGFPVIHMPEYIFIWVILRASWGVDIIIFLLSMTKLKWREIK